MALLTRRDRGENKRNPTMNLWLFGNGITTISLREYLGIGYFENLTRIKDRYPEYKADEIRIFFILIINICEK